MGGRLREWEESSLPYDTTFLGGKHMANARQSEIGAVAALWRYPVKSMLGEELQSTQVTDHGLYGDRAYSLLDRADGKVAIAKNPRKWSNLFAFRATLIESSGGSGALP